MVKAYNSHLSNPPLIPFEGNKWSDVTVFHRPYVSLNIRASVLSYASLSQNKNILHRRGRSNPDGMDKQFRSGI